VLRKEIVKLFFTQKTAYRDIVRYDGFIIRSAALKA